MKLGFWDGINLGALGRGGEKRWVSVPQYLLGFPPVLVEGFEDVANWSVVAGTADNNLIEKTSGVQSIKTLSGLGTSCQITRSTGLSFSADGNIRLDIYIHDPTVDPTSIFFYLASQTNFSKYFIPSVTPAGWHLGWNTLNFIPSMWSNDSTGDIWNEPRVAIRIRNNASPGETPYASFDSLYTISSPIPAVVIVFDDGDISQYTTAYPIMQAHNIPGTAYIITGIIGDSGIMNSTQLGELYIGGWAIGNHTNTHTDLTTLTQEQIESEFTVAQGILDGLGFSNTSKHVAYPYGSYNATVLDAMTAAGMLSGRLVDATRNPVLPKSDMRLIECKNIANTTSLATAKGYIDTAHTRGETVFLLFHKIVASPSTATEWATADFQALIDYIVAKPIQPMTIDEWYRANYGSVIVRASKI